MTLSLYLKSLWADVMHSYFLLNDSTDRHASTLLPPDDWTAVAVELAGPVVVVVVVVVEVVVGLVEEMCASHGTKWSVVLSDLLFHISS